MEFDDNREALLGDLFSKNITRSKTQCTNMTNKDGLKVKFMAFEKLKKQELAKWWDGATLKKYIENKRIPRGLRILIFPNFEDLEVDLLQEWEEGLHEASYKMLNILVTNLERKVKRLREEINRLEKEIKELNLMEATQKNYEILKKELSCYQLYLKDKKQKKINRDDNDYAKGRIFTFARRYDDVFVNKDSVQNDRNRNTSTCSSSISLSSCDSDPGEGTSNTFNTNSSFLCEVQRFRLGNKKRMIRTRDIGPEEGEKT
ncbi:hypothetical protein NDU88_003141 [Pleurodeles waltl]|uniref:Uncharacterized protein n=1 Tax=Pleurodeles waltl TaxID=8319 RepID=A0AAV7V0H7_PLEWA|nr:hypothetical protein NDU88_003141 [Pleurodeles waltl]